MAFLGSGASAFRMSRPRFKPRIRRPLDLAAIHQSLSLAAAEAGTTPTAKHGNVARKSYKLTLY